MAASSSSKVRTILPGTNSSKGVVEVALGDVLVEVVGEEEHGAVDGGALEHERRVVSDHEVGDEQEVVDLAVMRRVEEAVRVLLGDRERLQDQRVDLEDDDGVLLLGELVEAVEVDADRSRSTRPGRPAPRKVGAKRMIFLSRSGGTAS